MLNQVEKLRQCLMNNLKSNEQLKNRVNEKFKQITF